MEKVCFSRFFNSFKYYQLIEIGKRVDFRLLTLGKVAGAYGIGVHELLAPTIPKRRPTKSAGRKKAQFLYAADVANPHVTPQSRMGVRGFAGVADHGVADETGKITLETRRQPLLRTKEPEKHLGDPLRPALGLNIRL